MEGRTKKRMHSEIEQEKKADPEFFVYTSETTQADIPKKTLTHLTIDSSVTEIPANALRGCRALMHVHFPETLTRWKLGIGVFSVCPVLLSVLLPEGLKVIESGSFRYCSSLESVKIPPSVIKIEEEAFYECFRLSSVDLPPRGLLEIGVRSFCDCRSLETLHILSTTVSSIGKKAFSRCSGLKNIILPPTSAVRFIGDRAFFGCRSLSHFRIPSSVTVVFHTAFEYCESLVSIELPEGGFFNLKFSVSSYSLVNFASPPKHKYVLSGDRFSCLSKLYKVAESDDRNGYYLLPGGINYLLVHKLKRRFDHSPLNKLCYYHSYHSSADAMVQLRCLMEDDPLAATMQTDEFGMTPLHVLSLSQSPNMDMLLALMKEGKADHVVQSRDRFGSTPMDYLCLNHMPNSGEVIRAVLQTRFDHWLMGSVSEGSSKSETTMRQAVDEALAAEDGPSRSKEIVRVYFELVKYEHRMKILSLLELCLWQIKIDEICSKGQSVDRESCRVSSGAPIVIPHVLPFLDKLQVEDYVVSS